MLGSMPKRTPITTPLRLLPYLKNPKTGPVRTPVSGLLPSDFKPHNPDDGDALTPPLDPEEAALIKRVKAKAMGLVPVRVPVPLTDGPGLQEAANRGPGTLGALLTGKGFQVTEEEIDDAAEEVGREDAADSTWEGITKQMIRSSCAFFAQEVLTGPVQAPYNGKFFISEHHEEWDDLVTNFDRVCVLAPRDHGKTFFFNFAYPLWKASTMPWGKGFILSATAPQAERILEDIIAEVEGNPELHWLIPTRKESRKWSSRYVRFSNGHRIYARGFGTKVRGFHPDYIIVDDGLNDETAYSELVRRKQTDYFYNAISNMVTPGGQIVVVGTPFHQADLYADLDENDEYEFRKYQAIQEDNTALWPERYCMDENPPHGVASLPRKRREIGPVRFTREFMCEPVSDDMSLFPLRLFKGDPVEQFNITLGMPKEFWEKAGVTRFVGVDFAMSSNVSADYTVVWTMGIDGMGNRWIIDIQRERGLAYQDQLSLINSVGRKYEPALMFLEDNQMQRIFGDELIRTSDLPIRKFTTGVQKHSLEKGIPSLRVLLENSKFRIPRGDKHSVELTDIWIAEMRSFTWIDGKLQSVGGHDDAPMACWICDQAIRQGGFSFTFGDDEFEGSLDDLMAEMTGEDEDVSADDDDGDDLSPTVSTTGAATKTKGKPKLSELEGDDLLRAILKKRMPHVKKSRVPRAKGGNGGSKKPKEQPSASDLVDESDYW